MEFSEANTPVLSIAIQPMTPADREKLSAGLRQLMAEDPTFGARVSAPSGDVTIAGTGEEHLELIVDRLKREFNVEASVGRPQILYKEALTRPADGEAKYAGHGDGRGSYGHVKIHLYPGESGGGCVFENRITGGEIPRQFITSIEEGIRETSARGLPGGAPIDDVRVVLYDGSYHDADSTATAFKIAGSMAFQDATRKAAPVLLEPLMRVDVMVPVECEDDVISNLAGRHGEIRSREITGNRAKVHAVVPVSGLFGYSTDLRSRTLGRATWTLQFDGYQQIRIDPGTAGDDRDSLVNSPLRPMPTRNLRAAALPEPDHDWPETSS